MFREFYASISQLAAVELQAPVPAFASGLSPIAERTPAMAWSTPVLIEICIGLEINGYLPAEL
jgi:coenzyme PQQ precursor peptide PqqA